MKSAALNTFRGKALVALVVAAAAAGLSGLAATQARAGTIPYHSYSISCPKLDYWGNRIKANPIVLNVQDGVGLSYVDGSVTYHPTTKQFIYFKLWAYSHKYGRWYSSPFKRVYMGTPNPAEAYDSSVGVWRSADQGFASNDLAVGPNEVALSPNTGTGTWKIAVETYWAPPFITYLSSFLISPTPASGGLDVVDYATNTCTF